MKEAKKKAVEKKKSKYEERFSLPGMTFNGVLVALAKDADRKVKARKDN